MTASLDALGKSPDTALRTSSVFAAYKHVRLISSEVRALSAAFFLSAFEIEP
jgi:hypothetical protein